MRHAVDGRRFGRNTSHRLAMLQNLANSVIEHEHVITTVEKAKEARRVIERLITLAKRNTLHARRLVFARTRSQGVVTKLFGELSKRYEARPGGYTRIVKLSDTRRGDGAEMAVIELVDHPAIVRGREGKVTDSEAQAAAGAEGATPAATDPFKKARKLFSGKRASSKAGSSGAAKKPARAARKGGSRGEG